MTTGVRRKIELAKQIEEAEQSLREARNEFPIKARRREIGPGVADERIARREGILATLKFCQANELDIRDYIAKAQQQPEHQDHAAP